MEELNKSPELWKYDVIFGAKSWQIIPSPTKPLFGEEKKPDTFIPGVVPPFEPVAGKLAWVVNRGKKKDEFKALRGEIDRFDSGEIWLKFPNYTSYTKGIMCSKLKQKQRQTLTNYT